MLYSRWFSRNYPIAIEGRANTIYIFPRTNMEKQRLFNILYERAAIVRRERNTLSEELFYDFIAAFFQAG